MSYQFSGSKRSYSEARGASYPRAITKTVTYRPKKSYVPAKKMLAHVSLQRKKNLESHFVDMGQQQMACNTTGSIYLINTIAQGVTVNQRLGSKALLQSVLIRGLVQPNTAAVSNNWCILLVYDRMSNGAAIPAITDILDTINTNSMNNDSNSKRFKILRRITGLFSGQSTAAAPYNDCPSGNIEEFIKVNKEIKWNTSAATGVQSTIQQGAIYIVSVGTAVAGATDAQAFIATRTRFTEDY